jgi:PAS domain S-box-containing protein
MSGKNLLSPMNAKLAIVFVSMLAVMFVYELTKQILNPSITLWESHAVTILFTSIIAVILIYFPFRSTYREHQKAQDALRLQLLAEEKFRKSEMQYRSFVESAEDSIYTVDRECRYLLINTRHLARRGLSPDIYSGRPYGDFHSAEETRVFTAQVQRVLDSKRPVQDEYEQNGRYYIRKLNPVTDPALNEVIAVTVISSDITDSKTTEKDLKTTNRKLNLINDITHHDILNQLTALSSYLALAGEHSKDLTIQKYIVKCEQGIDTIQAQILFACDYQKIGAGSPQWQNVSQTIQKARMPLKMTGVTIDDRCSEIEIFADPLLEKVYYNLLENAIRHAGPQPEVRFSVTDDESGIILVVEDNGPGIPPENKANIFLRGFGKNTGHGLFLIREILSITGISIRETGEEGRGSRFEISVPARMYRTAGKKERI